MKRTIITLALILLGAASAFAQAKTDSDKKPSGPMPTVDQVLENYVKAIGGKDAFMKVTSRVEKGTLEIAAMGVNAPVELYSKAPSKSYFFLEVPSYGVIQEGFDGTVAWASEPQSGLRDKTGAELAETKLDHDFYKDVKLKDFCAKRELTGVEPVDGRDAYVVACTPAGGSLEKMYFDKQNGLMVRHDFERESPQGRQPAQQFFTDFREVDGVKLPHSVRIISGMGEMTIKLTEIKQNIPIDDTKFGKPAKP
jgi:outer membrane lipoprotein-sorting protein